MTAEKDSDLRELQVCDVEKSGENGVLASQNDTPPPKHINGNSWQANEEQVLPKNNLPLVFFALLLATFLVCSLSFSLAHRRSVLRIYMYASQAALDQTMYVSS